MKETKFSSNQTAFSKEIGTALFALCIARVAMSFTPILIRFSDEEIGPNPTVFWREAIAFILLGVLETSFFLNRQGDKNKTQREPLQTSKIIFLLLAMGIVATAYISLWTWAVSLTTVTNCTLLDGLLPIFTTLGAWLFLGQVFDRSFLIGMAIVIGGTITIGLNDFSQTNSQIYGDLVAISSIFFYAIYHLLIERLRVGLSTTKILLWRCGIGSVIMLPILLVTSDKILPTSWKGWFLVVSLALLGQFLSQGLVIYSLKKLSAGFVTLSMLAVPILSTLEARIILSERLSMLNCVGAILVLSGMYLAISSSQGSIKE